MNDKSKPKAVTAAEAKTPPLFQVTLLKGGLEHNGRTRNAGDVIHVSAKQIEFLHKREFISNEAAAQASAKAKE